MSKFLCLSASQVGYASTYVLKKSKKLFYFIYLKLFYFIYLKLFYFIYLKLFYFIYFLK